MKNMMMRVDHIKALVEAIQELMHRIIALELKEDEYINLVNYGLNNRIFSFYFLLFHL